MISDDERNSIIEEVVEKVFLRLPETIGNLMKSHAIYAELNKRFYEEHPEFVDHRDIVIQVVSKIEGANPLRSYTDILNDAVPDIRSQISTKSKVDMKVPTKDTLFNNNGEL